MRFYPWTLAALLVATLASAVPAQAAETGIVSIDISKEEPAPLLAPDEVDTINRLQDTASPTALLSSISPDDAHVLAGIGQSLGFLNIQDGSFAPLDVEQLNKVFPLALLGLGEFVWTDAHTLVSVGVTPSQGDTPPELVLAIIDSASGELGTIPLKLSNNSLPISLSPDATKILVLLSDESQPQPQGESIPVTQAPVNGLASFPLPVALQDTAAQLKQLMPGLATPPLLSAAEYHALQLSENSSRLIVYDVASGDTSELTTLPFGSAIAGIAWKPNATSVAVSVLSVITEESAKRGNFDGALISEVLYQDVTGNLPPDQNPFLQNNTLEIFDMLGGPTKTLRAADGDGSLLLARDWSPDSQTLLVEAVEPGRLAGRRYPVYTLQFSAGVSYRFYSDDLAETGRLEAPELAGPGAIYGRAVSTIFLNNDELIINGLVGSDLQPFHYNRVSGELRNIADRAGVYVRMAGTHRSRQIAFLHTSFTSPPDLYRLNADGSALVRLSWVNAELEQFSQTRQDPVSFTLADGSVRTGTLIQPKSAAFPPENVPIVAWQEGGPGVPMFNQWAANVENPYALLPNLGTALLVVPLAGRPGYGPAAYNKLYDGSNFGQRDIDEMAEIMQQSIRRGYTSVGKVGITGCSYGGYFVWQSIIRHPDLYTAANPQCALVDAVTEWSRGFDRLMPYLEVKTPFEASEEYRRDSPIYNADKVKAAVLSFHGSDDYLPVTQNENMHLQVAQRGVNARMLKFIGAGHGLASPEWQRYAAQEQVQWFRTYLGH